MNQRSFADIIMIVGVIATLLCSASWLIGIDPLGLDARIIMVLTLVAPLILLIGFIASLITAKQPDKTTKVLRVLSFVPLVIFIAAATAFIVVLAQWADVRKEF